MDHGSTHPADRAIGIERGLDFPVLVALLGAGGEMLAPVLDPLDRPAEQQRGKRDGDLLGIGDELGPEPAADRRRHHADAPRLATQHAGDQIAPGMRRLGRAPEREQIVHRVVAGQRPPAFDRMAAAAMDREAGCEDAGSREGGLDIAEFHGELGEQIVGSVPVDRRRAGAERRAAVGDHRERLIRDIDQRGGVLGRVARPGDNHRHRLADMDDLAGGEDRAVAALAVGGARQADDEARLREMGAEIVERPDRADPRRRRRRALVDAGNRGMRQRAPHERRVQNSRQMDVVDEARLPPQQRRILDPRVSHLLPLANRWCRKRSACRSGRR